jgi:DNA replication protein DnaC
MEEVKFRMADWPQFARDFARADAEAVNCETCSGMLGECRNSSRGFRTVIVDGWPRGWPAVAMRPCPSTLRDAARRRLGERFEAAGIGERFWGSTFENYDRGFNPEAYEKARKFAAELGKSRRWLVLMGGVGTGKTVTATAVVIDFIERGGDALALRAKDAAYQLHESYQQESTEKFRKRLIRAKLLLLDDLGENEKDGEFMRSILKSRYEADGQTMLTTNLDAEGLGARYGMAVFSRLEEVADVVRMRGGDYRIRMA